jgi:hypothetical protein
MLNGSETPKKASSTEPLTAAVQTKLAPTNWTAGAPLHTPAEQLVSFTPQTWPTAPQLLKSINILTQVLLGVKAYGEMQLAKLIQSQKKLIKCFRPLSNKKFINI